MPRLPDLVDDTVPAPSAAAVRACAHDSWCGLFPSTSVRSESLPLPPAFVDFLLADGVTLPDDSAALPRRAKPDPYGDSEFSEAELVDDDAEADASPRFPELEALVTAAIERLGGAVLPKLNWSAPKDAVWLTFDGTLRCNNAAEVVLLLKASDCVVHDLCHAYSQCSDVAASDAPPTPPQLVLKQWLPLRPQLEFRCFVIDGELVGCSQRHVGTHFPFLAGSREELLPRLLHFFEEVVADVFPLPTYTFDVHLPQRPGAQPRLLDFNPWGGSTLPLLFSWPELAALAAAAEEDESTELPVWRVVEVAQQIRPGLRTGVPVELVQTGEGSALSELLAKAREQERRDEREAA